MSGILLVDKNADYSAIAVGQAGLYTEITAGLRGLFDLRVSAAKASYNAAPNNNQSAIVAGAVFDAQGATVDALGDIVFPTGPINGTNGMTIAAILQIGASGSATNSVVGSTPVADTTNGSAMIAHSNNGTLVANVYRSTSPTSMVGVVNETLSMSLTAVAGTYQLIFLTLQSEVGMTLYRPATGQTSTKAVSAGEYFYFNQNIGDRSWRSLGWTGLTPRRISMFADWSRVLSNSEMGAFYNEMKRQYGRQGLVI